MGKLREIENAPFRSPEEIREKQFEDLRALLAHAEARVPYIAICSAASGFEVKTYGRGTISFSSQF